MVKLKVVNLTENIPHLSYEFDVASNKIIQKK